MWARVTSAPAGGPTLSVRRPGSSNSLALAPSGVNAPQPTRLLFLLAVFHLSPRGIESPASPRHPPPRRRGVQEGRKRERALGSRSAMEVFNNVRFVRLRSVGRSGKYLAADTDGWNICVSGQLRTHNAVWAIQAVVGPDGAPYVLLRSAYGRYLASTDLPAPIGSAPSGVVNTNQANLLNQPPQPGFLWQAVRRENHFVFRCAGGRYLRANGRFLRWRRVVTSAGDTGSSMMLWDIENVPVRLNRPSILDPAPQLVHRNRRPPTVNAMTRRIRYIRADANGNYAENAWRTTQIRTTNLLQLRLNLAVRMGSACRVALTTVCMRAGIHGQLTPLLIDLPTGNERIDFVVLNHGTPVGQQLAVPRFGCSVPEASVEDISKAS
ncbi:hypothetical protein ACP4OV_029169 [Aristida adscensionis]